MVTKNVLHILFIINSATIICQANFEFNNCDLTAPLQIFITKLSNPLPLKNNALIYFSGNLTLKSKLPKGIFVKFSLARKVLESWLRLPCVGCDFGVDCDKLPELCFFRNTCENCTIGVENLKFQLPSDIEEQILVYIPNFVLNGDFWARVQIVDPEKDEKDKDKVLSCFEIYVTIKV
ncbi:uncharacterized protein LOC101238727 isoform X1 [Hydra vulgaris]|uniref:uncharacterized protein LOC101238727 isoform X1 n=1 Tax=Hydra vulgaris TaxID=6087 RepID=UPI001F5FA237|nr:uncharacterized protein LOC101238727 [Hydra vulgaris]